MAKYALAFPTGKNVLVKLDISKVPGFENSNEGSLQLLDQFTSLFSSSERLSVYLYNNYDNYFRDNLNLKNILIPLVIAKESKGKLELYNRKIVYEDILPYLDYNYLKRITYINKENPEFLNKFANYFYSNPQLEMNYDRIKAFCAECKRIGVKNVLNESNNYDDNIVQKYVEDCLCFEIYGHHKKTIKSENEKLNYLNLRKLAFHIANIDEITNIKETTQEPDIIVEQGTLFKM